MQRRFFAFLVHLVVSSNVGLAGNLLGFKNPSGAATARQEFGAESIHRQLKAEKSDNRDSTVNLETIDVEDFVGLIRAVAVDHPDEIGLGDVDEKSKESNHATDSFLESSQEEDAEDDSDSQAYRSDRDDKDLVEFQTRRELLKVANNLRMQPGMTSSYRSDRDDKDLVEFQTRRELLKVRNNLRMQPGINSSYRSDRDDKDLVEFQTRRELLKVANNLRMQPGMTSSYRSGRALHKEAEAPQRRVLESRALFDFRRNQKVATSEEHEGVNILAKVFALLASTSQHSMITDETEECTKVLLDRLGRIYGSLKKLGYLDRGNEEVPNEGTDNDISIDSMDSKLPRPTKKRRHPQSVFTNPAARRNEISTTEQSERINAIESKETVFYKEASVTELVIELSTDKSLSGEDADEVLPSGKMIEDRGDDENRKEMVIDEATRDISADQTPRATFDTEESTVSPVRVNHENFDTVTWLDDEKEEAARGSTEIGDSSVDREDMENNATNAADLKSNRVSTEDDESGNFSNHNFNTSINIIENHPASPFHTNKNGSRARKVIGGPDIGTTLRFGSEDIYNATSNKKAKNPGKQITLSGKKIDEESKEKTTPLEEAPESLGASPTVSRASELSKNLPDESLTHGDEGKRTKKKNVMDVILESINAIIASNRTKRTRPASRGKSSR